MTCALVLRVSSLRKEATDQTITRHASAPSAAFISSSFSAVPTLERCTLLAPAREMDMPPRPTLTLPLMLLFASNQEMGPSAGCSAAAPPQCAGVLPPHRNQA